MPDSAYIRGRLEISNGDVWIISRGVHRFGQNPKDAGIQNWPKPKGEGVDFC